MPFDWQTLHSELILISQNIHARINHIRAQVIYIDIWRPFNGI
ncbi:MAG: hypothetical protein JWO91_2443 [Acidobacteriaceae bacterium]|nr:hypothetical protein [Acidobacteriaceae bacterium]